MKKFTTLLMALVLMMATANAVTTNNLRQLPGTEKKSETPDSRSLQPLKPLFEVFTSSTCPPCASANPIIDNVLNNNPGEYSLIKYQMNWPGSGDPYYTPQGGNRRSYYGVNSVPDMFANGNDQDPFSFSQGSFNYWAAQQTSMGISLSPTIDESGVVTVNAVISSSVAQAAGLRAHIAICEKKTTGNVGNNGETEFHYVMMRMLPSGMGTALAEIPEGGSLDLTQSYNMNNTFAEELDDLVAVVFVQNNSTKEILQSEMMDVLPAGTESYSITFNVKDYQGNILEGAEVTMDGVGSEMTDVDGQVVFADLFPDTYTYGVVYDGLMPLAGSIEVVDQDVSIDVVLEATNTNPDVWETFEDYTAGAKLVEQALAQGKDFWTCWSGDSGAGGNEDPTISNDQAAAGSNSVLCDGSTDFVLLFGDLFEGKHIVSFDVYVPSGKVGYYNLLQAFGPGGAGAIWGMEVYFNPGGVGDVAAADNPGYAAFSYAYDTWIHIENIIDLNADEATLIVGGVEVATWQWSIGAAGSGTNTLAAMDVYAATTNGSPKMYYDNFDLESIEGFAAPSNLTASVDDNDITLQWDAPMDGFIGFNVYRDNEVIAQEISETTYVDMDLLPGLYIYNVKAIYDEGVSAGAGPVEAYIEGGTDRDMVLLEIGTGTWCVYCPGSAMGADDLVENGHNVAVIEYHNGDNYETSQSTARLNYYGINAFPTAEIDGIYEHAGGSATISLYPTYLPSVEARTDAVSLFDIDLNVEMTGENSASASVTVDNVYPYPGTNIKLHVVCTESHIQENWHGMSEVNFVMREMFPNASGTTMDFSSSTIYTGSFDVDITGYVKNNCEMVAFLQDNSTKEILQAAKFDFEDIVGFGEHALRQSINIYPNPANDMLNIEAKGMTSIRIMNHVGQLMMVRNASASSFVINVSDMATGMYFVEITTTEGVLTEKVMIK